MDDDNPVDVSEAYNIPSSLASFIRVSFGDHIVRYRSIGISTRVSDGEGETISDPTEEEFSHDVEEEVPSDDAETVSKGAENKMMILKLTTTGLPWERLPAETYYSLMDGGIRSCQEFRRLFLTENLNPRQLGSIPVLYQIFTLCEESADESTWLWLGTQVAEMLQHGDLDGQEAALRPLGYAICGYSILRAAEEGGKAFNKEQSSLAAMALHTSSAIRATYAQHQRRLMGDSIRAVGFAMLRRWGNARMAMAAAIQRNLKLSTRRYHPTEFALLLKYRDKLVKAKRTDDLVQIVMRGNVALRHVLLREIASRPRLPEFCFVFYGALASISNPVDFFDKEFALHPNSSTQWTGTLLFVANARFWTRAGEAAAMFHRLESMNMNIPVDAATSLCARLDARGRTRDAIRIYQVIKRKVPALPKASLRRMFRIFVQRNMMDPAKAVLSEICARFRASFEDLTLIPRFHSERGEIQKTILALQSALRDDWNNNLVCLQMVQRAYIVANDPDGANEVLQRMTEIKPTLEAYHSLLDLYASRGEVGSAVQLFEQLLQNVGQPDIRTFTLLVKLFSKQKDLPNVNRVVENMLQAGIEPDGIISAAVLNADVNAREFTSAASRWAAFPERIQSHPAVITVILKAFIYLCVPFKIILGLFRRVKKPDAKHWALIILAACDTGKMQMAQDLYKEMDLRAKNFRDAPSPDVYIYSTMMWGYMRYRQESLGRRSYDLMLQRKILPTSVTYGMIVHTFARGKYSSLISLDQAHQFAMSIYTQMKQDTVAEKGADRDRINSNIFAPLISAAGRKERPQDADAYFELAVGEGSPTIALYTRLMDVHRRVGRPDKVLEVWAKVFNLAKKIVRPDLLIKNDVPLIGSAAGWNARSNQLCIPLSVVIDSLSKSGRVKEIKAVWKATLDAGFGFDASNYNHYAIALAQAGDLDGAFSIARDVLLPRWDEVRNRRCQALRESRRLEAIDHLRAPPPMSENEKLKLEQDREWNMIDSNDDGTLFPPTDTLANEPGALGQEDIDRANEGLLPPSESSRRRKSRRYRPKDAFQHWVYQKPQSITKQLLEKWRPHDVYWRPSNQLQWVLSSAYSQIQSQRPGIHFGVAWSADQEEGGLQEDIDEAAQADVDVEGEIVPQEAYGREYLRHRQDPQPRIVTLPAFNNVPICDSKGEPLLTTPGALLWRLNRKYGNVIKLVMFRRRKIMKEVYETHRARLKQRIGWESRRRRRMRIAIKKRDLKYPDAPPSPDTLAAEERRARKFEKRLDAIRKVTPNLPKDRQDLEPFGLKKVDQEEMFRGV